jgi:hypothetical protein
MTEEGEQEELEPEKVALSLVEKTLASNRVVIDFDVIALFGLTGSIYALGGPKKAVDTFLGTLGLMGVAFGKFVMGSAVGEILEEYTEIGWDELWKFIFPWGPLIP